MIFPCASRAINCGSERGGIPTTVTRRIVHAGVKYVVDWLALSPTRLYASPPAFSTERGRILVDSAAIYERYPRFFVTITGTSTAPHSPVVEGPKEIPVIGFELLPLSENRVELRGRCLEPAVEPFLVDLLKEIDRLWADPPARPANGAIFAQSRTARGHKIVGVKDARFLSVQPPQAIAWLLTFMHDIPGRTFEPTLETPRPNGPQRFFHGSSDRTQFIVQSICLGTPIPLERGTPPRPFEPQVYASHLGYLLRAEAGGKRAWRVGSGHEAVRFTFTPSLAGGTKLEVECLESAFASFIDELLDEIDVSAVTQSGPDKRTDVVEPIDAEKRPAFEATATDLVLPRLRPADEERYAAALRIMTPLRKMHWSNTRIAEQLKQNNPQLRVKDRETVAKVIRYGDAGMLNF